MGNLFANQKSIELSVDMSTSINLGDWIFKSSYNNPLFVVHIKEFQEIGNSSSTTSNARQSRNNDRSYTVYEFDITSKSVVESIIKGNGTFWYRSDAGADQTHIDSMIDKCLVILNKREYQSFKNGYEAINSGKHDLYLIYY